MRFAAEVIGSIVLIIIFCLGVYWVSDKLDEIAKAKRDLAEAQREKSKHES